MRDGKVIYGKLRIVLFGNVSNPEIQKHIDDCTIQVLSISSRGYVGSFADWSYQCIVFHF